MKNITRIVIIGVAGIVTSFLLFYVVSVVYVKMNTETLSEEDIQRVISQPYFASPTPDPRTVGYRKKHHLCTKITPTDAFIVGDWELPMITAEGEPTKPIFPGIFSFSENGTFVLTGYAIAEDHQSPGTWQFDPDTQLLRISFTQDADYWNESVVSYDQALIDFDAKGKGPAKYMSMGPSGSEREHPFYENIVERSGFSPQESCHLTFSFMGWTFSHVVKAGEVLSDEELEQYREKMGVE